MKKYTITLLMGIVGLVTVPGYCDEGPAPLQDIKVVASVTQANGLYRYSYSVTNPSKNNSSVKSVDIFVGRDINTDTEVSGQGLNQCVPDLSSTWAMQKYPYVAVGSESPQWSCGYGAVAGLSEGLSYGWAARQKKYITPGKTLSGFVLITRGIPGIRDILVEPKVDSTQIPQDRIGDEGFAASLKDRIKWTGKTVGPKAPPKMFDAGRFIGYLITLVNQSSTQGWIDNAGITNSLLAKLNTAQSKVTSDPKTAKNTLNAFMSDVSAQNGKHLAGEAYALLFFNAQYAVNHM